VLRQVIAGGTPRYCPERAASSAKLLAADLQRQFSDDFDVTIALNEPLKPPISMRRKSTGKITAIDLHSPVAPSVPLFASGASGLLLVDELLVRKNLGEAVAKVASAI
jgi:hypothetical protein